MILFVTGCNTKFLDLAPGVSLDEDKVFADPVLAAQFADNAYSYVLDDYLYFDGHRGSPAQASDEALAADQIGHVRTLNQGLFHDHSNLGSLNDIGGMWTQSYSGIRVVNKTLARMDEVVWTSAQHPQRIKGEMFYLRAYFYFELVKRFGGVIIIDKAYNPTDDIDFPRSSFEECVSFILADIAQAESLLSHEYDDANYGRPTIGAAKALKARLLLYAASPLHNSANNLEKWKSAAQAAQHVIDMGRYSLHPNYAELLSPPGNGISDEYILIKSRGPRPWSGMFSDRIVSPGSGGTQGVFSPTQNHVDLYEMANGLPISDPQSGYDPEQPYTNRDPRFYANILYNDAPWQGRRMQMWNGGNDYREGNAVYTATRYYCKKFWPEVYQTPGQQTAILNFVFYRYAEILLNYAEAQNEAAGPDASVYAAINQIRARAGMPELPQGLSQADMRTRIHNERAIELAFENHRWYDILRWKKGPEIITKPITGMNVERQPDGGFKYTKIVLAAPFQRVFEDYMHLYPIPRNEVQKSKAIEQNPEW